ncbi:DOMON domain-containing protein, partial [Candidatus Hakubella thermalkaliphila]
MIIIILTILIFSCLYSNLLKGILSGAPRPSEETVTESPSPETVTEEETGLTQEVATTEITLEIEKRKHDSLQTLQYRAANGEPVFSLLIESPPQIDGNLDEWMEELVPAILETHPISQPTYLPENYTNPSDLSGTFMVAYDEERLALASRVNDDVFSQPFHGSDLFNGDSSIISLDTDLQGDFYERANNLDDYRVGLSPGDFSSLSPEAYIWVPQETKG